MQWVLVTCVGFLVSLLWVEIGDRTDIKLVEGAIGASAIAFSQALVLRQHLAIAWWWILVSIFSWGLIGGSGMGAIGWVAPGTLLSEPRIIFGVLNGTIVGAMLGLGQWLVLRQQVKKAWTWILANVVGWAIGLPIGWTVGGILRQTTRLFFSELIGLTLAWVVVAGITGVALVVLLRGKPA